MAKFDWQGIVKGVAPALAAALGGPMAGMAVKVLSETLLGKTDGTAKDIEQFMLTASPDQLLALREVDNNFKLKMEQIGVDVFALEIADKKSARELYKYNAMPQIILTVLFIGGYFLLTYGMLNLLFEEAETNKEIMLLVSTIFGIFTGEVPRIMSFWFGSSLGSKEKTRQMGTN